MWQLTVYADEGQTEIAATWRFARMKDAATVLGVKPSALSNYYHQLIRPRGILAFCAITKCGARRRTCGRITGTRRQKCTV